MNPAVMSLPEHTQLNAGPALVVVVTTVVARGFI